MTSHNLQRLGTILTIIWFIVLAVSLPPLVKNYLTKHPDRLLASTPQETIQPDEPSLDWKIELASNQRMASIVAYQIQQGFDLGELAENGYLTKLSTALKSDFVDDNLYANLALFGAQTEYVPQEGTTKLIREKWLTEIAPGSYFDKHPSARLVLPTESVDIPNCPDATQPYLSWALAHPYVELAPGDSVISPVDVEITEEFIGKPQFRFLLKLNDAPLLFDTEHRILVDVGCHTPAEPTE